MKNKFLKYHTFLLCLFSGMIYALGFPIKTGLSFALAPLFSFFLFNWSIDLMDSMKKKFIGAALFSMGVFFAGFYWIPETIKEFGNIGFPFNYIMGLAASIFLYPHMYFFVWIKKYFRHPVVLAFIYVALEIIIPTQFPAHLGHGILSLAPTIQLIFAQWGGAYFYSFFIAIYTFLFLDYVREKKTNKTALSFIILVLCLHIPFSFMKNESADMKELNVRLVQPNIGNFLKLDSERGGKNSIRSVFDSYYELSTHNAPEKLDLIVWPETAYPLSFYSEQKLNRAESLGALFSEITNKTNAQIYFGGYDSSLDSAKHGEANYQSDYNTAYFTNRKAELVELYHKIKLIPFGEGLPFGPLNPYLSKYLTNISYFSQGDRYTSFKTDNDLNFAPSICYEILFTGFIREMLNNQKNEAQFMINLTNDSWYGDTSEPQQHLFLSKWRALEFNLPVIRATNTGISLIMYPDGSESDRLKVNEKNYLDVSMKLNEKRAPTLYQKMGYSFIGAIFLLLMLIELIFKGKSLFQDIMQTNKA